MSRRKLRAASHRRAKTRRWAFAIAASAGGLACAGTPEIRSSWRDPAIVVDGAYSEWSGRLVRIDDDRSVALGIANDRSNLYLCLVTRDFDVQTMIERTGFTLWLDPEGGQHKRIGFRVGPVQATAAGATPPYVEIVQYGAEYGEQLVASAEGPIEVVIAARADVIAYEMRLELGAPLAGASARIGGVTLAPGAKIGLGIETEAFSPSRRPRPSLPPTPPPDQPRPDDPSRPRDPRDPRAGDYEEEPPLRMPRPRKIEPLHAWVVVQLATSE